MKRTALIFSALVALVGVSGCSSDPDPTATTSTAATAAADGALPAEVVTMLDGIDVQGEDVREVITAMDQIDQARPLAVQGSIRTDQVVFSQDGQEVAVPIPGDEVYVSVAPFVSQTHDCYYHALGSCQGELVGEDVHVTITDADGTVLVDEAATTYANGFVGYWLPQDTTGTITITQGGLTGEVALDTTAEGPTCVTTLQLT